MLRNRLSLEHIEEAARVIDPAFLNSPQFESEGLSRLMPGVRVVVKIETMNPIRSFKGRGADYFVSSLPSSVKRLACASAGNFGQGLGYACRKFGIRLDVFASEHANPAKVEAIRWFGAEIHRVGHDFDAAKCAGKAFAAAKGILFVEDGKEPEISEGAGTVGVELAAIPLDALLVPLGNGALIGGVARWTKHVSPKTKIIGVCAAAAPSMRQSWERGAVHETSTALTIADGIGVRQPIPEAVQDTRELVDQIAVVGDRAMRRAVREVWDALGVLVESSGASGVAALRLHADELKGQRVGVILTGGNASKADQHGILSK